MRKVAEIIFGCDDPHYTDWMWVVGFLVVCATGILVGIGGRV